jgi:hypothetical protein
VLVLKNTFHNTSVITKAELGEALSVYQVKRIQQILCGMNDCKCGTTYGSKYRLHYKANGDTVIVEKE